MPIHAVLMPDGRVMSYGTDRNGVQTAYYDYDVWDPALGTGAGAHQTLAQRQRQPTSSAARSWCCSTATSRCTAATTSRPETNTQNRDVTQYRPASNTLVRTGSDEPPALVLHGDDPAQRRGLVQGGSGGADFPEVRDGRRLSSGCSPARRRTACRVDTRRTSSDPTGTSSVSPTTQMYRIDPAGTGSITSLGTFPTDNRRVRRPGDVPAGQDPAGRRWPRARPRRRASIIDINGATPQVTALPKPSSGAIGATPR